MNNIKYENRDKSRITGSLQGSISLRPIGQIVTRGVLGICLLLLKTKYSIFAGIFFLLLAFIGLLFIKDKPVMDVYDDSVIIYNLRDSSEAYQIYFIDLKQWSVDASDNKVYFTLNDDTVIPVRTSRYLKAYNLLVKSVPDKSEPSTMEKIRERLGRGK